MLNRYHISNSYRYILYVLAVLPVFIFRDYTPDNELRYLSIADEALCNGSIFTFTNHGLNYADKPPLYLWIVMFGKFLLGKHSMLFLGIFSFVPALVILHVMDKWVRNVLSESERLIGQLMLLTSGFFMGTAIVLRMDMLMCMFIVLALYTFFRMYRGRGKPHDWLLFPVFVFLAIFTKGPMGIIVPLISTSVFLILKRELHTIGKYWGWKTLAVLLTLCGIWFAGVYAEGGSQYLENLLFNQTLNRAMDSFHHKEPFYYYFETIWYSLAPWSLLYIGILVVGLKKKLASTDLELFFLVVALSTFVSLSIFSSKLAVYMLPAIPFIAYIALLWITKFDSPKWMLPLIGIPAGILSLALPGIFVAQQFVDTIELTTSPFLIVSASILSISGIVTLTHLIRFKLHRSIGTMSIGILLAVFVLSFGIPKYNSFIGLNQLCDQAKNTAAQKGAANYYYCEMSRAGNLDVYLGVKPEMLTIGDLYKKDSRIKKPAILFLRTKAIDQNDSLKVFVQDKKIHQMGGSCYIEIE
ncbi:MAG TPA: glycosyltransferase family 39 protein [Prolixibacteraceae bacterium]|nr:glycosyltransferase family 39 protein [Prolixibacteraceae bacterium]